MILEILLKEINEKSEWLTKVNNLDGSTDESTQKYLSYIAEHRENIGKAYHMYKFILAPYIIDSTWFINEIVLEHDASKYSKEEFEAYRQKYYPREGEVVNEELAEEAWVHHYSVNHHHPEFYTMLNEKAPGIGHMPMLRMIEMILDWTAMSIKFKDSPYNYYIKNKRQKFLDDKHKTVNVEQLDFIFTQLMPVLKEVFPDSHKDK